MIITFAINHCDFFLISVTLFEKVHGEWGEWSVWTTCNVTCSGGLQQRQRQCNNPTPQNGGNNCTGREAEIVTCNDVPCPRKYQTEVRAKQTTQKLILSQTVTFCFNHMRTGELNKQHRNLYYLNHIYTGELSKLHRNVCYLKLSLFVSTTSGQESSASYTGTYVTYSLFVSVHLFEETFIFHVRCL